MYVYAGVTGPGTKVDCCVRLRPFFDGHRTSLLLFNREGISGGHTRWPPSIFSFRQIWTMTSFDSSAAIFSRLDWIEVDGFLMRQDMEGGRWRGIVGGDFFRLVSNRLLFPRTRQIHVCLSIEWWSGFIQQFLFVAYRIFDIFTIRYVI